MRTFTADKNGESFIWWHVVDYARRDGKKHFSRKLYVHVGDQCFGVYLSLFTHLALISVTFSTIADENLHFALAVWRLFYFGFSIERLQAVRHLPGVKWSGNGGSGEREIRLSWRPWSWHWGIWTHPDGSRNRWRDGWFDLADFLLGRMKCTEEQGEETPVTVILPEGSYTGKATLVHRSWKRPRWHQVKRRSSVDIDMDTPIPVPGDGENAWDCEDDAIYGGSYTADSIIDGIEALRNSVIRQRSK